ncbi:LLM class flavin-dependent oxidoreductase [Nocardia sp. NBC_00565]|uniref:LLM class flavin-dependent oxidoreductase n=1 Tax=Nocardia sp. NBC_00565 TaxID=2975993 RepID=UPI002E80DF06|nr:LLM class flavin-dependent oxidoreductase [Nocardia sp. NBC_00565]WUC06911.1 LLM class flavin-dependent oxidoreductase [Nocardia sp. NBC_00565]
MTVTRNVFAVGIELDGAGYHPAAWRRATHEPDQLLTGRTLHNRVSAAENAGFTLATFDDSILPPAGRAAGRIDAITRASYVAATTSTIGLVATVATTYAEPFHTSSQLATLDYASRGRGGWIATADPAAAATTWGRPARTTEPELAREQRDSIEVARRLWDSWEDDAAVRDYAASRFLDRDKLHYIDFSGETFSVKGPAIVPRPPQGQVVVFADGTTEPGEADVILVSGPDLAQTLAAADRARGTGALVFAELDIALDIPAATAAERLAELNEHTPADPGSRLSFEGAPADLVRLVTELSHHVDGVRLHPAVIDEDLPALARYVLPALFRSGVTHRPVPGSTLRANLGLARPINRYAKDQH